MLTMKAKYALRAMSELARSEQAVLQAHELAARCRAPGKFLETILVELRGADSAAATGWPVHRKTS